MVVLESEHEALVGMESSCPELLFQEARQRRRRRWLTAGVVIVVFILGFGAALAAMAWGTTRSSSSADVARPVPALHSALGPASFSVRPVLCFAPVAQKPQSEAPISTLPSCGAAYAMSVSNLNVTPISLGYSWRKLAADPAFVAMPSTPPTQIRATKPILLPGEGGLRDTRFVLGPAAVAHNDVAQAGARLSLGAWGLHLKLTAKGSTLLDAFLQQHFHSMIALVVNGRVVAFQLVEPTQVTFSPTNGSMTITGLTHQQAEKAAGVA